MKLKSFLIPLLTTTLAMSGVTFSLTACNKSDGGGTSEPDPTPPAPPDPPQPDPEVKFNVEFVCKNRQATISNYQAIVNKKFTTYVTINENYVFDSIVISNRDRVLNIGTDYTYEESSQQISVNASAIVSDELHIVFNVKPTSGQEVIVDSTDQWVWLMNPALSLDRDYETRIVDSDTTKIISDVNVSTGNTSIPSTYDETTQTLTIAKDDIPTSGDINVEVETSNKPYEDYIFERSFSIRGYAYITVQYEDAAGKKHTQGLTRYQSLGTAWIIDDATPNILSDYNYYLGTNFHVVRGIDTTRDTAFDYIKQNLEGQGYSNVKLLSTSYSYGFADKTLANPTTGIVSTTSYLQMKDVVRQNDNDFLFSDEVDVINNYYPCVDFHVYKANLQNENDTIMQKLDTINLQKMDLGYINKFVAGDNTVIKNKTKHIGGYPYRENIAGSGGKWTYHEISNIGKTDFTRSDESYHHTIDSDDPNYGHYDVGAGTRYANTGDPEWMGGGASGSVIITEDYEISGIYWGHWGSGSTYMPAVTFLISDRSGDEYNFVQKFITYR